jgi:Cysteine-rich secretory protein family
MKIVLSLLLSINWICSFSQGVITLQDKPFVYKSSLDSTVWKSLDTEPTFKLLSQKQQEFFYWTNVFRQNPRWFYASVVKEFIKQFPEANKPEVKSLERDIQKSAASLPYLMPDLGLLKMSSIHASDLSKRGGVISHKSANGKDFVQRINEAGSYRCGAENLFVGNNNPLEALVMLLIDFGVADKGHRLNLLDPSFTKMGASLSDVSPKKIVLVQVFACK